ncbi:hypothetical protein P3T18_000423 [Paraburkholderia sp. GAS199]|uniref:hypothetical protein n=1 Tax=Paraburkholderia sp. GAS199 TaxID=3035126 RepID=UPI003D1A60DA
MEHLVRVLNDRDRRVLAWAREQVGDAAFADAVARCGPVKPYISTVCRRLGLTVPPLRTAAHAPTATGEKSLARIRRILAERAERPRPTHGGQQASLPLFG